MKRRLVRQAGQAITITLPIEWIRENNLKPGNEVELDIVEKSIIIRTGNKSVGKSVELKTGELKQRITRDYIHSAYALGIDEIIIESDINIYKILGESIGYAVVKQKSDTYTIKDISGTEYTNLEEIFKQIFQMLISFYDKVITEIFINSKMDMDLITQLDSDINKYTLYLERAIIKHAYDDNTLGKIMFAYAYALEQIGDEIYRAGRTAITYSIKNKNSLKQIYDISNNSLLKLFELHYQFSNEKLQQLMDLKEEIRRKTEKLKTDNHTTLFLSHAVRITEESSNLIQLILMLQLKKQNTKR